MNMRRVKLILSSAAILLSSPLMAQSTGVSAEDVQRHLVSRPDPIDYYRRTQQAAALVNEERWGEAETILRELTTAYPFDTAFSLRSNWGYLALALRRQEKHAEAIQAYGHLIRLQGPGIPYAGFNARYWVAVSQVALGRREAALTTLEQMVLGEPYFERPQLWEDPHFSSLRDEPRFRAIVGREKISGISRATGWRRDIDHLAEEVRRTNPSGHEIPHEFFRRQRELHASVEGLSDEQVVVGLSRMLQALQRGHTGIYFGLGETRPSFKQLPLRFYRFPEGLHIVEASEEHKELIGAKVLSVGAVPADEVLRRLEAIESTESAMEIIAFGVHQLTFPALLNGLGILPDSARAEMQLLLPSNAVVDRAIEAVRAAPPGRLAVPPAVTPPLWLRHTGENHWFELLPAQRAIYVQVNAMLPDPDESLADFGLRLRHSIDRYRPANIIVDLRHNNGGNSFMYVELLRTLARFSAREDNVVYAIIGRRVYSAAANFVSDLERIVRPVFVGEATGQTGNQWGDEHMFQLPYSGLSGSVSGTRWQLSHPWDQRPSIVPHVPVQLTAAAYFQGTDPVLDTVFRLIRESVGER